MFRKHKEIFIGKEIFKLHKPFQYYTFGEIGRDNIVGELLF